MTRNATFEDLVTLGRMEHPYAPAAWNGMPMPAQPIEIRRDPPRCCHLDGAERCPRTDTMAIVDGDPREATYACEEHRAEFAGEAWPVGSG